ncbi:MAG: molybdopterin cofactor-binding domain-containing protein [Candidatus Bathyarchaeota archaeon]
MSYSIVGKSVPLTEALSKVTGQAKYLDDIELPNMLYARILRSEYPHAKILKIDVSKAEKAPGVGAVVTAKDVPLKIKTNPILADDKVRCVGDPVAAVAAESEEEAEDALQLIDVDYEELPAVFDPREALKADAPKVHDYGNLAFHQKIRFGDVEGGFKQSDEVFEDELTTQKVTHCTLETHAAMASVDGEGKLTVWTSPGLFWSVYTQLLRVLQIPSTKLRFIKTTQGGGFGGKNPMMVEPYPALLALKCGRPVKLVYNREEEFTSTATRHSYIYKFKTGVKKDGRMISREVTMFCDAGAYNLGSRQLTKGAILAQGPYFIPNIKVDGYYVHTNNLFGGIMRGFGAPQVTFAQEVHTDMIAERLGMDPLEFRLKNIFKRGDRTSTGTILHSVGIKETILKAAEASGWKLKEVQQ